MYTFCLVSSATVLEEPHKVHRSVHDNVTQFMAVNQEQFLLLATIARTLLKLELTVVSVVVVGDDLHVRVVSPDDGAQVIADEISLAGRSWFREGTLYFNIGRAVGHHRGRHRVLRKCRTVSLRQDNKIRLQVHQEEVNNPKTALRVSSSF